MYFTAQNEQWILNVSYISIIQTKGLFICLKIQFTTYY